MKGGMAGERNVLSGVNNPSFVAASFSRINDATAAVDWFRNQAIDPDAIVIAAAPPGAELRLPQRGDNERTDLKWIVALDVTRAPLPLSVAKDALRREGGKILARIPKLPATSGSR